MSRKKRRQEHAAPTPTPSPEPALAGGQEVLRRWLLGMLTALIVARPFVLGEDPGLVSPWTDNSNLFLTLFWMIAAVGWAAWRAWSRRGSWYGGLVEAGLLAAVVLVFVGAGSVARYQHPAHLIGWEWLVLFLALFLVRQLALTDEDRRGLLSVFLATVVVLSAYALYQYTVELPANRNRLSTQREQSAADRPQLGLLGAGGPAGVILRQQLAADREEEDLLRADLVSRQLESHDRAFATFAQADTFAGYLVLFLPALGVAAFLRWRRQKAAVPTLLTVGCVLLAGAALWTAYPPGGMANLRDTWSAALAMLLDHPWLGVGAGNFSRHFPQYAPPTIPEDLAGPRHFAVELGASYGVFALASVLLALGTFFYRVLTRRPPEEVREGATREGEAPAEPSAIGSAGASPSPTIGSAGASPSPTIGSAGASPSHAVGSAGASPSPSASPSPAARPRWEFYLGGMAGLLLGYILREAEQAPDRLLLPLVQPTTDEVLTQALVAGGRSVLWFAVFALFEGVPWTRRSMALALAVGVAALLLHLSVADGISFPSIAQPLWLCVGLALGSLCLPSRRFGAVGLPGRTVPLPIATGVAMGYLLLVFVPVLSSASLTREAFAAAHYYREQAAKGFSEIQNPPKFLRDFVLVPLGKAFKEDPQNSHRLCQLAHWYGEIWLLPVRDRHPRSYIPEAQREKHHDQALAAALQAQRRDPDGREGYLVQASLSRSVFAPYMKPEAKKIQYYVHAARAWRELARLEPHNPRMRFFLAEMLFASGQAGPGREAAREALRLDGQAARSQRLRPDQRRRIDGWLKQPTTRPSR